MRNRTIGGITVSAIGLGAMPMSIEGRPDEDRGVATIHAALDAGVTFIDTADAYNLRAGETGHNERLIAKALASYPGDTTDVLVATKGGHIRPGDGSWQVDGSPTHIKQAAARPGLSVTEPGDGRPYPPMGGHGRPLSSSLARLMICWRAEPKGRR